MSGIAYKDLSINFFPLSCETFNSFYQSRVKNHLMKWIWTCFCLIGFYKVDRYIFTRNNICTFIFLIIDDKSNHDDLKCSIIRLTNSLAPDNTVMYNREPIRKINLPEMLTENRDVFINELPLFGLSLALALLDTQQLCQEYIFTIGSM